MEEKCFLMHFWPATPPFLSTPGACFTIRKDIVKVTISSARNFYFMSWLTSEDNQHLVSLQTDRVHFWSVEREVYRACRLSSLNSLASAEILKLRLFSVVRVTHCGQLNESGYLTHWYFLATTEESEVCTLKYKNRPHSWQCSSCWVSWYLF